MSAAAFARTKAFACSNANNGFTEAMVDDDCFEQDGAEIDEDSAAELSHRLFLLFSGAYFKLFICD